MYYSNNINTALQIGKLEERSEMHSPCLKWVPALTKLKTDFTTVDALHKDLSNPRSKVSSIPTSAFLMTSLNETSIMTRNWPLLRKKSSNFTYDLAIF